VIETRVYRGFVVSGVGPTATGAFVSVLSALPPPTPLLTARRSRPAAADRARRFRRQRMPSQPETITLAAIGLAAIAPFGALLTQERRTKHERTLDREREEAEARAAAAGQLRTLVDEAMDAAQTGMTYLESVGPRLPPKRETDKFAELVRSASWRLDLYLGGSHEVTTAFHAVTLSFNHWNDVAIGTVELAKQLSRPDEIPVQTRRGASRHPLAAARGKTAEQWLLAREQTRAAVHEFGRVALHYVGIAPQQALAPDDGEGNPGEPF